MAKYLAAGTNGTGYAIRRNLVTHPLTERSILFIRCEQDQGRIIETALKGRADSGWQWTRGEALLDALRYLHERSFDLIISDLYLPDAQGLATLRHLKQHAPHTPVIVLCHGKDRDTGMSAVRRGAHDFFCYEDLDSANLSNSVAAALKQKQMSTARDNIADRRNNARFPCRLAISYQALEHPFIAGQGTSETVNISSKGLLFRTDEPLQPGQLLQVSVDWPARLENQIPLKLVAEGRIVRNSKGEAAMKIDKYEFRTRRTKADPAVVPGMKPPAPKSRADRPLMHANNPLAAGSKPAGTIERRPH